MIKKLHPQIRDGFYGKVNIELEYKNGIVGKQPHTDMKQSHLITGDGSK